MWFKTFALIFLVFVIENSVVGQTQPGTEDPFQLASKTQKNVLLVFAGSDWCAPCIRFEKEVLNQPEFTAFASGHLVVFTADFPQRRKLANAVQQQNEKLAERYNPKGLFPNILLLKSDGSVLSNISYTDQSARQIVDKIKQNLPDE